MEVESDEVKPKVGGFQVEKEKEVVEVKDNMGSTKEASDVLEKDGVQLWTNGSRPVSMPSIPNATIPTTDQLTFFYRGKVFVFEAVPEEKVREIMLIAASAVKSGEINNKTDSVPPASTLVLTRSPSLCKLQAELPITRRQSLQRFFEKRRDRLVSKNPYPTPTGNTSETAKDISTETLPSPSCAENALAREDEIKIQVAGNIG